MEFGDGSSTWSLWSWNWHEVWKAGNSNTLTTLYPAISCFSASETSWYIWPFRWILVQNQRNQFNSIQLKYERLGGTHFAGPPRHADWPWWMRDVKKQWKALRVSLKEAIHLVILIYIYDYNYIYLWFILFHFVTFCLITFHNCFSNLLPLLVFP